MGRKYTEAQKKASLTYQRNKAQIKITTEIEQRDEIKKYAESKGMSVTELFLGLIKEDMRKNNVDKIYTDCTDSLHEIIDKETFDTVQIISTDKESGS